MKLFSIAHHILAK